MIFYRSAKLHSLVDVTNAMAKADGTSAMAQRAIPCMFMRGGTSRGPFSCLRICRRIPKSGIAFCLRPWAHPIRVRSTGSEGATTVTSKVAMVSPSQRPGIDVDYHFAQVWLDKDIVDTAPSCGNMLAGVGPFAIERGLVTPDADETRVRIFDVNTGSRIKAIVQTPGRDRDLCWRSAYRRGAGHRGAGGAQL